VWAGVDSVWEQEKPEARKMLENRAESPRRLHALLGNLPPTRTPIETRRRRQRAEFLHTTQSLAMSKKQNLPKTKLSKS